MTDPRRLSEPGPYRWLRRRSRLPQSVLLGRPETPAKRALRIRVAKLLGRVWLPPYGWAGAPTFGRVAHTRCVAMATHCRSGDPERLINPQQKQGNRAGRANRSVPTRSLSPDEPNITVG